MSSLLSLLLWCICTYDSCAVYGWIVQFPFQFPQHSLLPLLSSATRRTTIATVTTTTMAMATIPTPLLSTAALCEHEYEPTNHASITALPFPLDVFDFLNENQISWNKVDTDTDNDDNDDNNTDRHMILGVRTIPQHHHVIALHRRSNNTTVGRVVLLLHLIPTPTTIEEVMEPTFNKQWTDTLCSLRDNIGNDDNDADTNDDDDDGDSVIPDKVIHLHQDIWEAKPLIVQSRILAQVGMTQRRIFARKTIAKRINATVALHFLHHHHLWDATRSKYYYGLFVLPPAAAVAGTKREDTEEELVAVAAFSSRRKVRRNNQLFRSHELIRFCSLRESTVVGGISKLLKKFIQEQQPDDIVTVVDRDWGDGSGWHHQSLGFETVAIMDPIVMAVNPHETGVRRQLVGAGISPTTTTSNSSDNGRIGLPIETWNKLNTMNTTTDANHHTQALEYLANDHYYPVYDSGVERLFKVVVNKVNTSQSSSHQSNQQPQSQQSCQPQKVVLSGQKLWHHSTPKYADTYYSPNPGISSLLEFAACSSAAAAALSPSSSVVSHPLFSPSPSLLPPVDFEEEDRRTMASWHTTSGTAASARLVFSAPSSLDPKMTVEVRKRPNGWHTVGIVSGERESGSPTVTATVDDDNSSDDATKKKKNKKTTTTTSIYHGIYKVDDTTHVIESNNVVSEYIKTMATLALSGLEAVAATAITNGKTTSTTTFKRKRPYRFLHYGYGAGTLVRFLATHCDPSSEHVVVELDSGVVAAAKFIQTQTQQSMLPTSNNNVQLQLGDAVTYHQQYHNRTMQQQQEKQSTKDNDNNDDDVDKRNQQSLSSSFLLFDCILIDVFDEKNQVPKEMYSPQFVSGLSHNLLTPNGIIVHNFHSGGRRHTQVCQDAVAAYATVFGRRIRRGEEHNNNNNNNKGDDGDNDDDGCCFWVESLDSKPNAGNVIVLASKSSFRHRSNSPTTTTFVAKSGNDDDNNSTHNNATKSNNKEEENNTVMRIHDDKHEDNDVLTRCARIIQTKYNLPFDAAVRVSPERRTTEFGGRKQYAQSNNNNIGSDGDSGGGDGGIIVDQTTTILVFHQHQHKECVAVAVAVAVAVVS